MIMGYQRSGTNALLKSLGSDPEITAINESAESEFFKDWLLRPEPGIRDALYGIPGTVLLKPISEATYRDVSEIFGEYRDYDLRVVWIYRDPVNVYYSCVMKWGMGVEDFLDEWKRSNQRVLESLREYGQRIVMVKYEDITASPDIFFKACRFLGINGKYLFRKDNAEGRKDLSPELIEKIEKSTSELLAELDRRRMFKPKARGKRISELFGINK